MIKVINSLYLTENGCCVKNRHFYPVHIRQGDIDGACSIYTLMMDLLIQKCISRNQLEDIYDRIKKSPEIKQLFHEFFDKHGLVRGGLYFDELARLVNRSFGTKVHAVYSGSDCSEAKDSFKAQIKNIIDKDQPIVLGVDFKKGGHAVLAIGYEDDEEGLFHVFCLDPGYTCNPTSYWNMVISLDMFNGKYKHQCLTDNPYNCPAIQISDTLIIERI